ncbi:hypothetical protein RhiirC2_769962 [Rhizophagus irregularis]|uniref:Uncharacterized protein n=1 Tax=Rhizophagus irregularis TaxID=588596 RepID=A0A2N1NXL6_9GLOM|nr:hypothetical protein RhiirC2_769962 [Rhizophagus irregularis]
MDQIIFCTKKVLKYVEIKFSIRQSYVLGDASGIRIGDDDSDGSDTSPSENNNITGRLVESAYHHLPYHILHQQQYHYKNFLIYFTKHKAILIFFNDKSYFDVNRGLGDDNSGGYDTSPSENNNMAGRLVEFDDVMVKVAYHHRSSSIRGATSRVTTFH